MASSLSSALGTAQSIGRFAHAEPERVLRTVEGEVVGAVWSHPPTQTSVQGLDHHALALHLSGCTLVEKRSEGRWMGHRSRVGSVSLVPAWRTSEWVLEGHCRVAHAYVLPSALLDTAEHLGLAWPADGLDDFFADEDAQLVRLLRWLLQEAQEGLLDSLALAQWQALLLTHLVRRRVGQRSSLAQDVPARRMALTGATLRRLFAHVEDHLAQDLTLKALAGIAHQSPDHFLRAFREAVGQTPHQYVLNRRLERAREWLARSPRTIVDIAQDTGFRGASHFAAAFRRQYKLTPSAWRAQARD
jgi:AraC family transcriptional regulator